MYQKKSELELRAANFSRYTLKWFQLKQEKKVVSTLLVVVFSMYVNLRDRQ